MTIENVNNTIVITDKDNNKLCFPVNSLIAISLNESSTVTFRLKGNRRNILSVPYSEVTNISSTSASDLITKINNILNK